MSSTRLRIPSKTFLVGEYSALLGGPAVVINTQPYFEVSFDSSENIYDGVASDASKGDGAHSGLVAPLAFHPESPAGKLLAEFRAEKLHDLNFSWSDPHAGKGGFGGSSAQFLSVCFWKKALEQKQLRFSQEEIFELRDELRRLSSGSEGSTKPSGYDLVSQMTGNLSVIRGEERIAESYTWNFESKDFLIVRTGLKVNTHDHLAEFNELNFSTLAQISTDVCQSFKQSDYTAMVGGVTEFQRELRRRNLSHQSAYDLLQKFLDLSDAGKCCGALGADSFLLFFSSDKSEAIRRKIGEVNNAFGINLVPVASSRDLATTAVSKNSDVRSASSELYREGF